MSLTNVKRNESPHNNLTNSNKPDGPNPVVCLKYLHNSSKCLATVTKQYKGKGGIGFLKLFQEFIFNFSDHKSITESAKYFTPKNGSKIKKEANRYVKNIIDDFKQKNTNVDADYISDSIQHFHLKPGGKGKEVVFGFIKDNVFHIIAIDPFHEFNQ